MSNRSSALILVCGAMTVGALGCGKSGGGSTTAPSAPTNRNPTIASITVSPTFGVSGVTTISMSASASDPDNDPVTYAWTAGSTALTGASTSAALSGDGTVIVRLTVSDGKGGTAADTRNVTIGTMTGTWSFVAADCGAVSQNRPAIMTMTQTGTQVTGTITFPGDWCNIGAGQGNSRLDPGAPGTIDALGNFTARLKIGDFIDIFLNQGRMDSTGRKVTGKPEGSGFGNSTDVFTLTKQ